MTQPASTVRLGEGAFIGIGSNNTSYATNATASDVDIWWHIDEAADSLQLERDRLEFNQLTASWPISNTLKAGQRRVTGSVNLKMTYGGFQDILRLLTGHNVSPTGGTVPYTYSFVQQTLAANWWLSNSRGMVIEVYHGGGFANSIFYQGCVLTEFSFKFEPNSFVEVSLSWIGRGYTIGAKSTPTYEEDFVICPTGQSQSSQPMLQLDAGSGLTTYTCRSATATFGNGADFRNDVTGVETLLPYPTEHSSAKMECTIEAADDLWLTILDDPESSRINAARLQIHQGSGATERQLLLIFDEMVLESPAEPRAGGIGVVTAQLSMMALGSSASSPPTNITFIGPDSGYNIT